MQTSPKPVTALVLQGGGALGAYQGGAYEALATGEQPLDWVAGISIGAINAALIAGNPPERRVEQLRAFWQRVSLSVPLRPPDALIAPVRSWWDNAMALWGMAAGIPGFFMPRPPSSWWPRPPVSWYDTAPLHQTLLDLVDFDRLNDGPMRFSVGAVDVESGDFTYFDNRSERIRPEHVMASGALPPGFPAVEIDGHAYWDGGVVSNTPLIHVMRHLHDGPDQPVTIFQVDLFSARGRLPTTLAEVSERAKDIQYSSRTRYVSDRVRERHQLHQRLHRLAALIPPEHRDDPAVHEALADAMNRTITLVHVIHRRRHYETMTKDYEFSQLSMDEHWQAGSSDMQASLALLRREGAARRGAFRVLDHNPDASRARPEPPERKPRTTRQEKTS